MYGERLHTGALASTRVLLLESIEKEGFHDKYIFVHGPELSCVRHFRWLYVPSWVLLLVLEPSE